MPETSFFDDTPVGLSAWKGFIQAAVETIERHLPNGPCNGIRPEEIAARLPNSILPNKGLPTEQAFAALGEIVCHSVAVWHPNTVAHLHCPVALPALAAEVAISALNQSMDSFDQAPSATVLEQQMTDWLCRLAAMPARAGATFTSGGTQSNYMGLLLARDEFSRAHWKHSTRDRGLHPQAAKMKILCSRFTHFSVLKSAFQLGLGANSLVEIDTGVGYRMSPLALQAELVRQREQGNLPFAVVATAGTTDFGSIDPLDEIADIAKHFGIWLHVDAAYGGALLLSPKLRSKLNGIGRASSISIDFHKAFYQPISCSAFLLSDSRLFDLIGVSADYLNPQGHEEEGFPDLVNRSLATTRRFDALKLWFTFQIMGSERLARTVDYTFDLAQSLARRLAADPRFDLLHSPDYGCVVFRLRWPGDPGREENLNDAIPKRLFQSGRAVLGHTRIDGRACLKVTLLNPFVRLDELCAMLDLIESCGREIAGESR